MISKLCSIFFTQCIHMQIFLCNVHQLISISFLCQLQLYVYNSMKNILNDIINLPWFRIPTAWQEAGSWSLFTKFKTTNIMSKQLVRARCKHYVTISPHNSDNIQLFDWSLNITRSKRKITIFLLFKFQYHIQLFRCL